MTLAIQLTGCGASPSKIPTDGSPPHLEFGGGSSPQIAASFANPCEIDLNFGDVPIGQTETATVRIDNVGSGTLDLSHVDAGLDPEFGLSYGTQGTIGGGGFGSFTITFQPYKTGQVSSSFTVDSDGKNSACTPDNQMTVSITGTGIQLSLVVQPDVLDFGSTLINTVSTKSVTLINKSNAPVNTITSVIGGADANLFAIVNAPTSLAANAQATVDISYAPLFLETRSLANVTFLGDDGETAKLNLFGEPLSEGLTLTPNPCDFGYVPLHSTAVCCTNVSNQANVAVTVQGVTNFAAGNAFALATTDDATPTPNPFALPVTVQGGTSAKVCFAFNPGAIQQYQGQVTLKTDDPSGTNPVVQLTGWGGGPQITCTPAPVDFGEPLENGIATATVLCTNTGTAIPGVNLTLEPPTASPFVFTALFDQTNNAYPLGGLAPGEGAQIDVNYTPSSASTDNGTLFIKSNGGSGQTLAIPLHGQSAAVAVDGG